MLTVKSLAWSKGKHFAGGTPVCPNCNNVLNFYSLVEVQNNERAVSLCYSCKNCGKYWIGTSTHLNSEMLRKTIETSQQLKARDVQKITNEKLYLPKAGDSVSGLGQICAIVFSKNGEDFSFEYKHPPSWGYYHDVKDDKGCFLVWNFSQRKKQDKLDCTCGSKMDIFDVTNGKIIYKCKNCGKTKNGKVDYKGSKESILTSENYTRTFKMRENVNNVENVMLDLPDSNDIMVDMGELCALVYHSDKENLGEDQQYIHRAGTQDTGSQASTEKPRILYYPGKHGGILIIYGGAMYISLGPTVKGNISKRHDNFKGWLVD